MPPKRKSSAVAASAARSPRKTRSMTDAGKRGAEPALARAAPAKKEEEESAAAAAGQKGRKRATKKEETAKAAAEPKGRKKAKKEADSEAAVEKEDGGGAAGDGKRVIVEAWLFSVVEMGLGDLVAAVSSEKTPCTQCRQFKIRAQKVKEDLESSVPGVSVIINPEKPRRGCLEIREEGGGVFISLLNMPRPFTAMKKLDMDEVIKDIAKKIS